jgi:VWFA-related protein
VKRGGHIGRAALAVVVSASAAAGQTPAAGQAQAPRALITSSTELVEVDVVVTDHKGAPVRGLTRDDFKVSEDGRAQSIAAFGFIDIPLPSGAAPARVDAVHDLVATNLTPQGHRVYVLVLDAFNVAPGRSDVVRKDAREFIDKFLGPDDLAAVVIPGFALHGQTFTSDKALLKSAVDRFAGRKSRSAILNMLDDAARKQASGRSADIAAEDPESGVKAFQARMTLESLRQICDSLGATNAYRRSVVLFSEGIEMDTSDLIGEDKRPGAGGQQLRHESARYASVILDDWQAMVDAARRANVALYTIEPRGNTMGEDIMQSTVARDPVTGRPMAPANLGVLRETQRGQGSLRTFATETGGVAVVGTDNLSDGFRRIVQANSSYYVLGYRPADTPRDGGYRKISVTVGVPDVGVVARKGYYAIAEDSKADRRANDSAADVPVPNAISTPMRELLASPLPVARGLPLRATGGLLRAGNDTGLVALVIELDTRDLPFVEHDGQISNEIELAYVAMDAQGVQRAGNRSLGRVQLPSADRATVTRGLRYVIEFAVPPGLYQVRVGAHESAGDHGGSALLDVDARLPEKSAISIGPILLTTPAAQAVPTTGNYPTVKAALPGPPTTARDFERDQTLTALVSVFSRDGAADAVDVSMSVRRPDGGDALRNAFQLTAADAMPDKGGYARVVQMPLSSLAPGSYELVIEAKPASGRVASRSVEFTVR